MSRLIDIRPDPKLDLVLERYVDVPREKVWAAWTKPEQLKQWFVPAPWTIAECELDLRPGGIFRSVMKSPEGQAFTNLGCYLEVTENQRLIWTDLMGPGYRPLDKSIADEGCCGFLTAIITLETVGKGTKYSAVCLHRSEESRKKHEDMGFQDGWGKCLDQMVTLIQSGRV